MPKSDAIDYFDRNAAELSARYNGLDRGKVHADLLRHLPEKGKLEILDIGAGSGADANLYASMGHNVVAVEPSKKMREMAKKTFKNKKIKWKSDQLPDLKSISASRKKFDVVYCANSLQYLNKKDRSISLSKMVSILKNNGVMSIQYPSPASAPYQFSIEAGEIKKFVQAFNKSSAGRTKLKILQSTRFKDFTGRKALDGADLYFHTIIIRKLGQGLTKYTAMKAKKKPIA